jgi:hypothetical protein
MIMGIQVFGIIFALFMVYLTFLYYKRGNYSTLDFGVWMFIWLSFMGVVLSPNSFGGLLSPLKVYRLMDLFTILSFITVFSLVFFLYLKARKNEERVRKIVREIALGGGKRE